MNKLQHRITGIYMIFFTLYSLATRFTLAASIMDGTINNMAYRLILILGCILALWQIYAVRKRLRTWDTGILLLFILVLIIGLLSNHHYGIGDNLFGLITFGFQLILFYYLSIVWEENDWIYMIKRIIFYASFLWNIACVGSIALYLMNIKYVCKYVSDHAPVRQGMIDGRLFGLFTDPNFAAFTSLLLIFGLWYIIKHTSSKLVKLYTYGSIIVNAIYLVMSNSRTVYLSVAGSVLFFSLLRAYKSSQDSHPTAGAMAKHLLFRGLRATIALIVVYLIILFPIRGIAKIIVPSRDTETEMVREDVNKENISNNRFTIWNAYLDLYKEKPLFGFSIRSALPYAEKNNPQGYLAETKYVTHNTYISLLVETGIIGFVVMAGFILALLVQAVNRCRRKEPITTTYVLFATWIIAIFIFGLCFHDIFFTLNVETMLFWCGLGYLKRQ